jgi:hypothetical protein
MNKDEVLIGIYKYMTNHIPIEALNLIVQNDIRVENFFAINCGVYLQTLLDQKQINSFQFQHTILLENPRRAHIDIFFVDSENNETFLELKHFSISQNRGKGRKINFYTGNTVELKKVGIVGDCEKLDKMRSNGYISNNVNFICCAFITNKPTIKEFESMTNRLNNYPQLDNWDIIFPIDIHHQHENLGFVTLQKNGIIK